MAKITYNDKTNFRTDSSVAEVNKVTDANMNEIKQVVNENYDELAVDYITEVGSEGSWKWKKWKSGLIEMTGNASFSNLAITQQSVGTWYGGGGSATLPIKFSSIDFIGVSETSPRSSGVYMYVANVSGNTLNAEFRAHASVSNGSCGVNFYIRGYE